jgi:hypothetical protein
MKRDEDELDIRKSPSLGDLNLEGNPTEVRVLSPTGSVSFDDDLGIMDGVAHSTDMEQDSDEDSCTSEDEIADLGTGGSLDAPLDITPTGASARKRNKFIGSIAKTVKTGTSMTGKSVVKGSKKVGKGTVRTGKAIIAPISRAPVHSKKPPVKEPKSAKRKAKRRREGRDHYVVVNRTL